MIVQRTALPMPERNDLTSLTMAHELSRIPYQMAKAGQKKFGIDCSEFPEMIAGDADYSGRDTVLKRAMRAALDVNVVIVSRFEQEPMRTAVLVLSDAIRDRQLFPAWMPDSAEPLTHMFLVSPLTSHERMAKLTKNDNMLSVFDFTPAVSGLRLRTAVLE
jgi:hypothetical protein